MTTRFIIVTAKLRDRELLPDEVSLFPTERSPMGGLSQDELFRLSPAYSQLYRRLIDRIVPVAADHTGLPERAVRIAIRNGVVVPTHFFLDRALRLDRFISAHPRASLLVPAAPGPACLDRHETFRDATAISLDLNRQMLATVGSAVGLPCVDRPVDVPKPSAQRASFRNNNYGQRPATQARRAASRLIARAARAVSPSAEGRYPVLELGLSLGALEGAGFYGPGGFVEVAGRGSFPQAPRSAALRSAQLEPTIRASEADVAEFLTFAGVAQERIKPTVDAFATYLTHALPPDLFEGFQSHVATASEVLAPFRGPTMIYMHAVNVEGISLLAAARVRNFRLVALQHGGHEGYEGDFVQPMEMDYPHGDALVSWGWTGMPTYDPARRGAPVIPLPSPFLSERARWPSRTGHRATHDLLFLPNKIYPWPSAAPTGASVSRMDQVGSYANLLCTLVGSAAERGISILHKPFNAETLSLIPDTIAALPDLGKGRYDLWEGNEKGLSAELLARARIILWDQPGTGFLECIARRIPTLVLWPRNYNRETDAARRLFEDLERVGVVARDVPSLLDQAASARQDASRWFNDPERQRALQTFARMYGWSDRGWAAPWRALVKTWKTPLPD